MVHPDLSIAFVSRQILREPFHWCCSEVKGFKTTRICLQTVKEGWSIVMECACY